MNRPNPSGRRNNPPVVPLAIILGALVIVAVIYAVIAGQRQQNPRPSGTLHSPKPNASIGPSPRY